MRHHNPKIGLFGGLFDPPHIGHLILASWVLQEFNLDKIIFIPSYHPPHKERSSPFKHRYKMTELSITGKKEFMLSDIETRIRGKTYTFKVLELLKKTYTEFQNSHIYLIIGADQWNEIKNWKNFKAIFDAAKVIVLPRPGYKIRRISPFYKEILISRAPLIDISSTMIRNMIRAGLNIDYLVSPEVLNYIKEKKLYLA